MPNRACHAYDRRLLSFLAVITFLTFLKPSPIRADTGPPLFPPLSSLNKSQIQSLIDNVLMSNNESVLEIGYFLRGDQPPLPQLDGYALVNAAIGAEQVGSDRWFALQSVRAFAALRTKGVDPADALDAYGRIFAQAGLASTLTAQESVRRAVQMYVFGIPGRINDLDMAIYQQQIASLLLSAWTVYYQVLPPGADAPPDWLAAIQETATQAKFMPLADALLEDSRYSGVYYPAKVDAALHLETNPTEAIDLLRRVRAHLPGDPEEQSWYFSTLVSLLDRQGDHSSAALVAQDQVSTTGAGFGALACEQYLTGDRKGFSETLDELRSSSASPSEVLFAGDRLEDIAAKNLTAGAPADDGASALLTNFLSPGRTRTMADDYHARCCLSGIEIEQGKFASALGWIGPVARAPVPIDKDARQYYYTARQEALEIAEAMANAKSMQAKY